MKVLYELRCPTCRMFASGYQTPPEGKVRGYCRKHGPYEAFVTEVVDIAAVRIRTFV